MPRVPMRYDRALLASAVAQEKLRTTTAARGRAYDIATHQQAAMPEQLLANQETDLEPGRPEQETGPRSAIDLTALRALKKSRADIESLELTAERLRHLQDAFTKAADREDASAPHPAPEDDQRTHHPQQPGPHHRRQTGL
ncbi:hypothetical protein [Streptomyces sp. NPDC017993]|uniref:hypothetical protein n=1 Tax=Streptomyces sp. NPDC017993 TaxID=3365027 RepID=UPI0037A93F31